MERKTRTKMKMLTDNLIRPRRTLFSLLTSNFSLPHLCAYKLKMPNKPNFQQSRPTVTLDMISTYNEKKLLPTKKNTKNPNPIQTQSPIPCHCFFNSRCFSSAPFSPSCIAG